MSPPSTAMRADGGDGLAATVMRVQDEWEDLRRQVAEGFHGAHCRANGHAAKTLETAAFLYALIELLSEKGVVAIDELDERKRAAFARQKQRYAKDRMGVILQDSQIDKYAFERTTEIDCASRVHLCKASCCRLPFALSRQDVEERVVRWDFGVPYMIEQGADGYCSHHDRCTRRCTIYQERPVPCRGYDCRNGARIWLDFERRIPNPAIERADWLEVVIQAGPAEETAVAR
jgi:Fe-S-cluster containining protein